MNTIDTLPYYRIWKVRKHMMSRDITEVFIITLRSDSRVYKIIIYSWSKSYVCLIATFEVCQWWVKNWNNFFILISESRDNWPFQVFWPEQAYFRKSVSIPRFETVIHPNDLWSLTQFQLFKMLVIFLLPCFSKFWSPNR